MAIPPEVQRLANQLTAVYADAWERVLAEQQQLIDNPVAWRRRRRLTEVQETIARLMHDVDGQAQRWLARQYPQVYAAGAQQEASSAAPFRWTQPHLDAVTALANDTFADLLAATAHVTADAKRLVRALARQQALAATIEGQTAQQAARTLAQLFDRHRITAIVYRDGSRHGLADYADLAIRAKTAVAYNAGTLGQLMATGTGWVEVFDGTGCGWTTHGDPDKANGTIRTVAAAAAHPIAHPRCRRSFGGRPDIRTATHAATASPTTTAAQRADQAAAEQQRAGALERRRQRTTRQARTARQPRVGR